MKRGPTVWDSMSGMREQSNLTIILENEDCKVIRASGKDGEGIMTFYQVFEGVYLMYDDFHMSECISGDSPSENILCITHCREGRIEMHSDNGVVYYMEPGDLRVDDMAHHKGNCYFPLSHYHGVTIGFQTDYAEESLRREMPGFHFDLQALIRKFCGGGSPFVIHNEPAVEHLFYQLYQLPGRVQKEYFKIKVIELLLYLSGMETDPYKVERPYFYNGQVEKIRAIRDLITSDLTRTYTAEELSQRFSISLTAMKRCFRSTYGSPMYAYLKEHRLNEAAGLLITRRDLKISEVGALVGYESPSKFTAVFRERMGQTPLEYRKTHGMEKNVKTKERSPMSWVFEFAETHKTKYIQSILLALVGVAFSIAPYFVIADIIRHLIAGDGDLHHMLLQCLLMAGMWLGRVAFHAMSTATSHKATFQVLANIRKRCTDKLGRISLGDVQSRSSGELKNILVEWIDSIETTLAHVFPEFTTNLACSAGVLIFLFFVNWKMALVSLITIPIGAAFAMGMMIGQEKSYQRTVTAVKGLNDAAVEYIGGIEVIKVFGKTKSSYERFLAAAKEGANSYIEWMRKNNVFFCSALTIMPATLVTVLPVGGLMVRSGSLSVEDFILIMILNLGLVTPLITCMSFNDDLAKLGTIIGEVTGILQEQDLDRPAADQAEPADNTVTFRNVHFGYSDKEVLHGVDLEFRQGSVSALVGPSGSGKSTIAKLLAAYWDVKEGSVAIGGVDIRQLSQEQYYKRIAYVSQDNFLFDDTVRENIRMGDPSATDEQVEAAAKACGCHDFILGLEKGYDTVVGGSGSHLSGGERQRIAIARAMLKNAPIVILDEATAYTDPENEALIQQSVAKLVQGKTLIVIAHRLSTIAGADRIYVINDGRVEDSGTHQELLAHQGLYSRMWEAHISARDSMEGGELHA